jgi:hypothetical protein
VSAGALHWLARQLEDVFGCLAALAGKGLEEKKHHSAEQIGRKIRHISAYLVNLCMFNELCSAWEVQSASMLHSKRPGRSPPGDLSLF